jgi:uncharacterized protein YidB (DUF937 family)
MDDLSTASTSLGTGADAAADPAALVGLAGAIQQNGGLDALVGKLRAAGLGDEVDSWVSTGANRPSEPQQLGQALGPDTTQQLSAGSGIDVGSLLPLLAMFLPQIVDMLTKNGSTPSGGLDSGMPDLGGLLGGLLGGALGGGTTTAAGGTSTATTQPGSADLSDLLRSLGGDKGR